MKFLLVAFALSFTANAAFAHGGGTDANGCHRNKKAGGYHCHNGPYNGQSFSSKAEAQKAFSSGGSSKGAKKK